MLLNHVSLVLQVPVLLLQALVGGLQAAVLPDQRFILDRLPLVERRQLLVITEEHLVGGPQLLFLFQRSLALSLHTALLALQLGVLGHEGRTLRVQGGVLHLWRRVTSGKSVGALTSLNQTSMDK